MKGVVLASVFWVGDKLSRNYVRRSGTSKIVVAATAGLAQYPLSPFVDHSADNGFGRR